MKNANKHINFNLLARYLSGELTGPSKWLLNLKLQVSKPFWAEVQKLNQLYSIMKINPEKPIEFNPLKAWEKVQNRIVQNSAQHHYISTGQLNLKLVRVAAVATIMIGLSASLWFYYHPKTIKLANLAKNHTTITTLPDGSQVYLGNQAILEYPKRFVGKTRSISLSGEAYFDVEKNLNQPFIIKTHKANVTVVGTSFNLKALGNEVFLDVVEGKVKITHTGTSESALVGAGEFAIALDSKLIVKRREASQTVKSKMKILLFQDETLADIVRVINNTYGSNLIIQGDELKKMRISVTFDNDISSIVIILSASFNLKVTRNTNGSIIISR